jgi:hypothetical protein
MEIVSKVDEVKADMLVIGSRGMGVLNRIFLGSISDCKLTHGVMKEDCVHHCHCTTIITRK